jgi:hypothetical protein
MLFGALLLHYHQFLADNLPPPHPPTPLLSHCNMMLFDAEGKIKRYDTGYRLLPPPVTHANRKRWCCTERLLAVLPHLHQLLFRPLAAIHPPPLSLVRPPPPQAT